MKLFNSVVCTLLALTSASVACGQESNDADSEEVEEIVVMGSFAQSRASAAALKRSTAVPRRQTASHTEGGIVGDVEESILRPQVPDWRDGGVRVSSNLHESLVRKAILEGVDTVDTYKKYRKF